MANAQKITEIIDEKAFKEWERFIESLGTGQSKMAALALEANELNKKLSGANSLSSFTKEAEKAAIGMEKLQQAQAQTIILQERVKQAELRTIQMTEQRVKREEAAALKAEKAAEARIKKENDLSVAAEKAARRTEEINKRMEASEADLSSSIEQKGKIIAQSEKDIERGLKASEAAAITAGQAKKKASQDTSDAVNQESFAYGEYRRTISEVIRDTMEMKRELEETKKTLKDNEIGLPISKTIEYQKTISELSSSIQANNAEIKRMTKENLSAEGSIDALESQLNSLRVAYRQLSEEERNNTEGAKLLLAEITKLDEEFKKQKRSMGQAQDDVGNYAAIWDKVPGPIRRVVDSLQDVSGEEGKITFSSMTQGLKALTAQAWAFVATPIGAAIAALTVAVSGAKLWFDYNKGLSEATRLTQQLSGETGDAAKIIRDDLMATAEVFGKNYKDVLIAVNGLVKEYGISFSEASELVNAGFIKGADASGNLLSNVSKYAPQMRAAGLSANEMMAVLARNEKEGIFSDKGLASISEATVRIRNMTTKTKESLEAVGIDTAKLQKDLLSGQTTMFGAIQQVSTAMSGFSDNSREVGAIITNVFARASKDAGLGYLRMLGDINTEQDVSLDNLTDIEKAQLMQLKSTEELNREYSALFDATGGGFELMMANIKVISTDLLVGLLKGIRNLYNWFVDLYNESILFRGVIETIPLAFNQIITAAKLFFGLLSNGFSTVGEAIKAILTGNFSDLPNIWKGYLDEMEKDGVDFAKETAKNFTGAFGTVRTGKVDRLEDYDLSAVPGAGIATQGNEGTITPDKADSQKAIDRAIRAKQAMENRLVELTVARVSAEKRALDELAEYNAKIYKDENNAFTDRFNNLQDFYENRRKSIEKEEQIELTQLKTLNNEATRLREEGKKEEYDALLKIIDLKQEEIKDKAIKAEALLNDEIKEATLKMYKDRYGEELDLSLQAIDLRVKAEQLALEKRYQAGEMNEREYQQAKLEIQKKANRDYIQNEIDQLQQLILLAKNEGAETRTLEIQLAKLKVDLSKETTDQQIEDIQRLIDMEKKAAETRMEIYKDIGNAAFELFDTLFERRLGDIEKDIELNDEEEERELNRIENSSMNEEQKALKTYAINERFAQKNEELEKKKIEMQRKQAKFQKAQAVLNIALSTGMGIARAFADWPFPISAGIAIGVGALGAIQLATALAQPLPEYWTGTESSEGGLAHVGERGSELFVTPDGKIGLTPPRDTIMNLEEGTRIFNSNETKRIMGGNPSTPESTEILRAIRDNDISNRELVKAFNDTKVFSTIITKDGWRNQVSKNGKFNKYLKDNGIH